LSQESRHDDPDKTSQVISEEPDGYEYIVDVKAKETFRNTLRGMGISAREGDGRKVAFTSERLIDLKAMKERGLLWSYAVAKVKRVKELLEVG
jgi:hypothetical protein